MIELDSEKAATSRPQRFNANIRTDLKPCKKRNVNREDESYFGDSICYRGQSIFEAAKDGNLPLFVFLWGIAAAKKINLLRPDLNGNHFIHFACAGDSVEVWRSAVFSTRLFYHFLF